MNSCFLVGNSGADAELKVTSTGYPMLNLSVATSKKVKEEWKSFWHKVIVFGGLAEKIAPQIKKGSKLFVRGEIQTREWQDSDGAKRSVTEILANEIYVIEKGAPKMDIPHTDDSISDDIPF